MALIEQKTAELVESANAGLLLPLFGVDFTTIAYNGKEFAGQVCIVEILETDFNFAKPFRS